MLLEAPSIFLVEQQFFLGNTGVRQRIMPYMTREEAGKDGSGLGVW